MTDEIGIIVTETEMANIIQSFTFDEHGGDIADSQRALANKYGLEVAWDDDYNAMVLAKSDLAKRLDEERHLLDEDGA